MFSTEGGASDDEDITEQWASSRHMFSMVKKNTSSSSALRATPTRLDFTGEIPVTKPEQQRSMQFVRYGLRIQMCGGHLSGIRWRH